MQSIVDLNEVLINDFKTCGRKAANLGFLKKTFLVPSGFVIKNFFFEDPKRLHTQTKEIYSAFDALKTNLVAVRSSSPLEDSSKVSFAGQFASFLNVPKKDLIKTIKKCFYSAKSERVSEYKAKKKINNRKLGIAVLVQEMIAAEISGVSFTANPVTKNTNEIVIEYHEGLGEDVVSGAVAPDRYIVGKKDFSIISKRETEQNSKKLDQETLKKLATVCLKVENLFGSHQDIEWSLFRNQIYILQARPITTL